MIFPRVLPSPTPTRGDDGPHVPRREHGDRAIETLAQIHGTTRAGRFTAGIVLVNDVVTEAAPIVYYMKRSSWSRDKVRQHCTDKGWTVEVVKRRPLP